LNQIMLGGTAMGSEGLNYFLELAKKYKATNLQKMAVFTGLFNEVMQLEQEFNEMIDFQKVKSSADVLKFKVAAYPGLHSEVLNILFKLSNYCDYEQKLIDVIALSQTQSSEDNRKKQFLRREDDFTDYPYLKAEMEKAKANKEYKPTPKCN
jgi:phosphoribulokinase